MFEIIPILAFEDNYIWLLHQHGHALVVDPGDAHPVLEILDARGLQLRAILVTHHHQDHTGGVEELIQATSAQVFAPAKEQFSFPHHPVTAGDRLDIPGIALSLSVLDVPGHTVGHVAYYGDGMLFSGDTLFGAGCGRLFEGTPGQMYSSLQQLAQLPVNTRVYCGHEYTERNLAFALSLEPHHEALLSRREATAALRAQGLPSLPSSMALELATNPFLRCHEPGIIAASKSAATDPVSVFAAIREMRNHF
ncbi:hydroxyacylglutathione hydrolase [Methylobacillus flagellatus]|uniref:Hydroxyacylglutathione hydrolase n=1 Tax=Methylobacillus flagellatus (strain ATCC 51484 / DSM 6875 / VKM B-1610 / KT) TaxID=265072 RepID=GLO2_METFK|nr:hydroxyacylglutathione hydrolase [Methylobacillus flagellatus]Q1H188.1 RecName: Full=Hydroxyacylglutathione hydrolase; AltName: Full=Glyoxalase II; Short=Glx II [Methylobacillus flagellatus KT]ABE49749.1 Hydroxyacylglutathione hydrolase [Methylobacillus flagellatus KT]